MHGAAARQRLHKEGMFVALWNLVAHNKRRYGGYIVHVGIVLIFLGITGSSAFQSEGTYTVAPGESFSLGRYQMTFNQVTFSQTPRADSYVASVDVAHDGTAVASLAPAREFFPKFRNQPASEVDIHHTLRGDLYLVLLSAADDGSATFKVYLNPLVSWIWLGGIVLIVGGVVTMLPDVRERRFAYQASLEEERAAA